MSVNIDKNASLEEGLNKLGLSFDEFCTVIDLYNNNNANGNLKELLYTNELLLEDGIVQFLAKFNHDSSTYKTYSEELYRFRVHMESIWCLENKPHQMYFVCQSDIDKFLKKGKPKRKAKTLSAFTYNKKLAILRALFSFHVQNENLEKSPVSKIRSKPYGHLPIRFLTKEQQEAVYMKALSI